MIVRLSAARQARTFRDMADARMAEALDRLLAGDRAGFRELLADVGRLDERADHFEAQERRLVEEHQKMARALELILERAGRPRRAG